MDDLNQNKVEEKMDSYKKESEEKEYKELAQKLSLEYVELKGYPISNDVLNIIPQDKAEGLKIISYLRAGNKVKVATSNPEDKNVEGYVKDLAAMTNFEIIVAVTTPFNIDYCLNFYDMNKAESRREEDVVKITKEEEANFEKEISTLRDVKDALKKVSVSSLLDILLTGSVKLEASDIHIEPGEKGTVVRYRIDGVLHPILSMDNKTASSVVSRIKLMSKMKLDLNKLPQDGKFFIDRGTKKIDIRVSTLPDVYGESVVLRLLDKDMGFIKLADLGFNKEQEEVIRKAYKKTHGLIFVTGPTGSGKTTTLYSILDELNQPGVKIITLEDPVEYDLPGVVQSQIDAEKNYTFASGLRSILRQDPDIILIGEIRDAETGEMATQASLTGHLVLTTLHTNDAPSSLHRLLDLGIRPFMVVDSINLIMAQRLVRRICEDCKEEYIPEKIVVDEIKSVLGEAIKIEKLYRAKGCDKCHHSGFKGRVGIYEMLEPSEKLKSLMLRAATLEEIEKEAKDAGMKTLEFDGLLKAIQGVTTPEEVWRVAKD
ncbi:type II/IV secretion system protein [bacterium]|nr:type II/IV secretion system protein [bacterium]